MVDELKHHKKKKKKKAWEKQQNTRDSNTHRKVSRGAPQPNLGWGWERGWSTCYTQENKATMTTKLKTLDRTPKPKAGRRDTGNLVQQRIFPRHSAPSLLRSLWVIASNIFSSYSFHPLWQISHKHHSGFWSSKIFFSPWDGKMSLHMTSFPKVMMPVWLNQTWGRCQEQVALPSHSSHPNTALEGP